MVKRAEPESGLPTPVRLIMARTILMVLPRGALTVKINLSSARSGVEVSILDWGGAWPRCLLSVFVLLLTLTQFCINFLLNINNTINRT